MVGTYGQKYLVKRDAFRNRIVLKAILYRSIHGVEGSSLDEHVVQDLSSCPSVALLSCSERTSFRTSSLSVGSG
jgi:hypothetical protein